MRCCDSESVNWFLLAALGKRDTGPLQSAVHRRNGCVQHFRNFGNRVTQHFRQKQRSALLRREFLQSGDECQTYALTQRGSFCRVGFRREHVRIQNRFDPMRARTRGKGSNGGAPDEGEPSSMGRARRSLAFNSSKHTLVAIRYNQVCSEA